MATPIDLEKMRSIGVVSRLTRPSVREFARTDGVKVKATTDELGNTVVEHAKGDRQDVILNAPAVTVRTAVTEERD